VEHVLFIRPDVAAVKSLQQYLTLDGQPVGNQGTPLHVMAKEDGQWRLSPPKLRRARIVTVGCRRRRITPR
jgi:hypothetical protein